MNGTIWRTTWRVALRRRRLLLWNVLVPVLLLAPVVASGAAGTHRAIVVVVFVAFFGAYGSCIPLIRDGLSGWAEKVWLTGYGGRRWLAERTAASVAIDFAQLLPVNLLLLILIGATPAVSLWVLGATAVALVFANLLGVLVASGVRALSEAALGCAVVSLFALHAAGVFRTPAPRSFWAAVEAASPFRLLHEAWLVALDAGGTVTASGPVAPALLVPPILVLAMLIVLTLAVAGGLVRRILA